MSKPKIKIHFNIIDILIVLLIVLCIVGIVLKFTIFKDQQSTNDIATISFTVYDIAEDTANAAKVGNVYLPKSEALVGSVIGARVNPNHIQVVGNDGKLVSVNNPLGRKNLTGTMRLTGSFRDNGFCVGNLENIAVGSTLSVYILDPETGNGAAVMITVETITRTES